MNKQNVVSLYNGKIFSNKKNEGLIHATILINPQNIMLVKEGRHKRLHAT